MPDLCEACLTVLKLHTLTEMINLGAKWKCSYSSFLFFFNLKITFQN